VKKEKKDNNKLKKFNWKEIMLVVIGIAVGVFSLFIVDFINNNYITNYKTLEGVRKTVQKGMPTYCEFELVDGINGYLGDSMTRIVSIDKEKGLFSNTAKYLHPEEAGFQLDSIMFSGSKSYIYSVGEDGNLDDDYASVIDRDYENYLNLYVKTFLDEESLTSILLSAKSFSCRKMKNDDFNIPKDVEFKVVSIDTSASGDIDE